MARTVAQIQQEINTNLVTNLSSVGITIDPTQWSNKNVLRLIVFTLATGIAILEQLMDVFTAMINALIAAASAATQLWIQSKMFQFQYDATTPQLVQLINNVVQYPVVDPTKRIITACAVSSTQPNNVTIKVAKGSPLQSLAGPELAAAQGYINLIGTIGIDYNIISQNPDQIYIQATIWFSGQYASVIQASVIAAITNWLANLSITRFDGSIQMSDLESFIRSIPGVNDVTLVNVRGRADAVPFASGVDFILNTATLQRLWNTSAGYAIPETTATKTLADSLTFNAQ